MVGGSGQFLSSFVCCGLTKRGSSGFIAHAMSPDRDPAGLALACPPAATLGESAGAFVLAPRSLEAQARGMATVQQGQRAN